MPFQSSINATLALGVPGELRDDGPVRAKVYELYSAGVPNIVGQTVFTLTTAQSEVAAGIAQAGGTGPIAGLLVNPKAYASYGTTSGGPLAATMTLPDYSLAELATTGAYFAALPATAKIGDQVIYDTSTGKIGTMPATTKFTASIAAGGSATADVLTVTAVAEGTLAVGQIISGVGVPQNTYIASLGTGLGNTGSYNLSTINTLTVGSEAMTTPNVLPGAAAFTATVTTNAGVDTLVVSAVGSGVLRLGQVISGVGIPDNTTIKAFGTGVGGTGNYTLSTSGLAIGTGTAMTADAFAVLPGATVYEYAPNAAGVGVIKL